MNSPPLIVQPITSNNSIGGNGCLERTRVDLDDSTRTLDKRLTKPFESLRLKGRSRSTGGHTKPPMLVRTSTDSTVPIPKSFDDFFVEKKKAQFAVDAHGRVHKETFRYQQKRTKKEVLDCWYTPAQFKEFRQECKKESISQQKTDFRKNFGAVYNACKKGSFKEVTKERAYISAASCRGLEAVVYPTLQADRKNLIITVLKTQHALPASFNQHKRDETLANASRFLSKQSRQLARVLGSGDAAVVVANERLEASKRKTVPQVYSS